MHVEYYSYRFAEEILEHENYRDAWEEITSILESAPIFIFPDKSATNPRLDVVQQVMNTYFDRRFAVDCGWEFHPLATRIQDSGLAADFRKTFNNLTIQAEVQFGNMSRWYSDVFKFQAAYSQNLIQMGLSIVPFGTLARRIDSNVVNFERCVREIPSAELSITLPILLVGLRPDENTPIIDLRQCRFPSIIAGGPRKTRDITSNEENRWKIVNGYILNTPMNEINPNCPTGPMVTAGNNEEE